MMTIEYATTKYEQDVFVFDKKHLSQEQFAKVIADKRVCVARQDDIVFGYARFGLFWDSIPFLNMLYVPSGYTRMGVGSGLLSFWEQEMKNQGHKSVLTSAMATEKGQHFFRKYGYIDCGNLYIEGEGLELILSKRLQSSKK